MKLSRQGVQYLWRRLGMGKGSQPIDAHDEVASQVFRVPLKFSLIDSRAKLRRKQLLPVFQVLLDGTLNHLILLCHLIERLSQQAGLRCALALTLIDYAGQILFELLREGEG